MKKIVLIFSVIILIIAGTTVIYFKQDRNQSEPKKLVVKSTFGKQGSVLGEFGYPFSLAVKDNYLFVADTGSNSRIQVLKINSNGSLDAVSTFGKEGTGLGEFKEAFGLAIKNNYLFVADTGNSRIQIFVIK